MCELSNWIGLAFLGFCSVSDLKIRRIHTKILLLASAMVSLFCIFWTKENIWSVVGGLVIGVIFWVFSYGTRESLGYADSWIILLLGAYLGARRTLFLLTIAFLSAGIVSLVGMVWKGWNRKKGLPFIPFLTVAYAGVMWI